MAHNLNHVIQQIVVLATGAPASVQVRDQIAHLYAKTSDWGAVAAMVDSYMQAQMPLARHGVSSLVQALAWNGLGLRISDHEAAHVTEDLEERGIASWSALFAYVIDELNDEFSHILEQRATAAEDFTHLLNVHSKDQDYQELPIFHAAAHEWLQGIGQSRASFEAAQRSSAELINRFKDGAGLGTVLNGYLHGATVYIDADENGVFDWNESSIITDQTGGFLLTGNLPSGQYVATGGVDVSTGELFTGTFRAPQGALLLTPLTTLTYWMLRHGQAPTIDQAEEWLFNAFELPRVDLSVFDPIASGLNGDTRDQKITAVKLQAASVQVANVLAVTRALLEDFVPRHFRVEQFALKTLITHLVDSGEANQWLDLSDPHTLAAILKDTVVSMGLIDENSSSAHEQLATTLTNQAAELLHELNALIQQSARQFEDGTISSVITALSDIAKVHTVVQTQAVHAIAENVPGGHLNNVISQLTGQHLIAVLDTIKAGFLDSQIRVNDGSALTNRAAPASTAHKHAPLARDEFFLDFDGTDDYIQIGSDPNLEMTTAMTMEAWIRPDSSNNANQMIINKEGEYEVGLFPDGTLRWAFKNTNPGWDWYNTGHVVPVGEWAHVAVSYHNGIVKTYVDGLLVHTYNGSGVIGDAHVALDDLRIGGRSNSPPGKYFDGAIAEVRIWNIVRSGTEILANHDQTVLGSETGLVGYWRFNEGAGSLIDDLSVLNNDGTLGGGVPAQTPEWKENYTLREDGILRVPAVLGVLNRDSDDAGHPLTALLLSDAGHGLLNLNADGSFTYTPDADFSGIDHFRYKAHDGIRKGNSNIVNIEVSNVNDVPLIASGGGAATANVSVSENSTGVTTITATDADVAATLTYSISGGNDHALFSIDSASGVLIFTNVPDHEVPQDANADNVYEVNVQVNDGDGGSDAQLLSVTVTDIFGF